MNYCANTIILTLSEVLVQFSNNLADGQSTAADILRIFWSGYFETVKGSRYYFADIPGYFADILKNCQGVKIFFADILQSQHVYLLPIFVDILQS